MAEQTWYRRYAEGIVIAIIAVPAIAGVTYLYNVASPMAAPLFYGVLTGAAVIVAGLGVCILSRMPTKRTIPTTQNIEQCVRTWLDSHRIAVKNDPDKDLHFRLRITLDSGKQMTILRSETEFTEYVQILTFLRPGKDEQNILDQLAASEKIEMILEMQLELARAKVGYAGLAFPAENFFLFRRVPIFPGLSEFFFIAMVSDIEAAMNLVGNVFLKARLKLEERTGVTNTLTLPSTSDTPAPELPATS